MQTALLCLYSFYGALALLMAHWELLILLLPSELLRLFVWQVFFVVR